MYLLLFAFWLQLNGKVTLEICMLGVGVTAALGAVEYVLFGYTPRGEWRIVRRVPLMVAYLGVLLWEVIRSSCFICRVILFKKRYPVEPTLVTFHTDLRTELGRFLLANSITLTPGTITIRVRGNALTVHCLDKALLDTSPEGTFQKWIRRLEA